MSKFTPGSAPLSLGVPYCHPVRKTRRDLIAQKELPFEFADGPLRPRTAEVKRCFMLRCRCPTTLDRRRLCRCDMNRHAANYSPACERARNHPSRHYLQDPSVTVKCEKVYHQSCKLIVEKVRLPRNGSPQSTPRAACDDVFPARRVD